MLPAIHHSSTRLGGQAVLLLMTTLGRVWAPPAFPTDPGTAIRAANEPVKAAKPVTGACRKAQRSVSPMVAANRLSELARGRCVLRFRAQHDSLTPFLNHNPPFLQV